MPTAASKTSRYRGVTLFASSQSYQAFVKVSGKRLHCGMWVDERDAAIARDRAALFTAIECELNEPDASNALGPASPDELRRLARARAKQGKGSRYFGVNWNPVRKRWDAMICYPGERKATWIAQFDSAELAAEAHDCVALTIIGPDALVNFPDRKLRGATIEQMRIWSKDLRREREGVTGRPSRRKSERFGVAKIEDRYFAVVPETEPRLNVGGFATEAEAAVARERMELAMGLRGPTLSEEAKRLGPATPDEIRLEILARQKETTASRYVGVTYVPDLGYPWRAALTSQGKKHFLGSWRTEREAAIAVDRAHLTYVETPGRLNLPRVSRALGPATSAVLRAEARRIVKETTTSQYRGVTWDRRSGRWVAQLHHGNDPPFLGRFDNEESAAKAYDAAAKRALGKKARLNFP